MKKRILIACAIFVIIAAAILLFILAGDGGANSAYPTVGDNLIVNGSFEELSEGRPVNVETDYGVVPPLDGWGVKQVLTEGKENTTDGSYALHIKDNEAAWARVVMTAAVEPNRSYLLTMDVKGAADGEQGIGVSISGDADSACDLVAAEESETELNAEKWTTLKYVYENGESTRLELLISCGLNNCDIIIDNVTLYEIDGTVTDPVPDDTGDDLPETVNYAVNGGFEQADGGKAVGINASDSWSGREVSLESAEDNVYAGSSSLKLSGGENRSWVQIPADGLTPGATYRVSFWMKGSGNSTVDYAIEMYTHSNGQNKSAYWSGLGEGAFFAVTEEWQYCEGYFTLPLPEEILAINLNMGLADSVGTVYLDEVCIQKQNDAEIVEVINERVFYYPEEKDGYAEMTFRSAYQVAKNYTVNAYLMDGDKVLAEQQDVEISNNYAVFNYDLSLLTEKEHAYTVKAEIVSDAGTIISVASEDIYIYDRPTVFNENGEYVEEDGSIFNPSFAFWGPDLWEENADLAAAGVNTILWSIPDNKEEALKQLDELHALGMKANVVMFWDMEPTGHPINTERVIETMHWIKDHPAIYAWDVADEPYLTAHPPEGVSVRELMIESFKIIRSVDKKYPVTYVENYSSMYANSDDYADIVLIDTYPCGESFTSYTGDKAVECVSAVERPVGIVLQSFMFGGAKPDDYELHSMIYQSYLGGVRYMGYYGIGHGNPHLEADPELWPAIQGFYNSGEWDILFKQYSSGKNPTVASSRDDKVWYDVFEQDGVYYAAIQNRSALEQTVTVELDEEIIGAKAIKWAEDVEVDAAVADGKLTVNLTGAQAVLIKLDIA